MYKRIKYNYEFRLECVEAIFKELLIENEYLRAENELLKELQALVQTDKKQKP